MHNNGRARKQDIFILTNVRKCSITSFSDTQPATDKCYIGNKQTYFREKNAGLSTQIRIATILSTLIP